ncbi:MAG: hypothetical protein LR011_14345 [Verrucomicrobia bacterium]|nr:hypothetical protein [Verrucomicrobiota bacterium]
MKREARVAPGMPVSRTTGNSSIGSYLVQVFDPQRKAAEHDTAMRWERRRDNPRFKVFFNRLQGPEESGG